MAIKLLISTEVSISQPASLTTGSWDSEKKDAQHLLDGLILTAKKSSSAIWNIRTGRISRAQKAEGKGEEKQEPEATIRELIYCRHINTVQPGF